MLPDYYWCRYHSIYLNGRSRPHANFSTTTISFVFMKFKTKIELNFVSSKGTTFAGIKRYLAEFQPKKNSSSLIF